MNAHVSPRDTRRPEFPATVHAYSDVLSLLADEPGLGADTLADRTDRVKSNIRRDMHKLIDAAVVEADGDGWRLTEKGQRWVTGMLVASGKATTGANAAEPRWPVDKIRPNPANRPIDPDSVREMAASIASAQDVLQPILLTPPDGNGVRMLLAGERRWRGVMLLADQADQFAEFAPEDRPAFPDVLRAGIRFIEREGQAEGADVDALLVTIIENSQREDLSPLEDAQQLKMLQDATGWSGAEVARRVGRAVPGSRKGEKDVTDKLRILREATPEQLEAYRQNGSWDALRDAVGNRRPVPTGPHVVNGVDYGNATRAQEARYALGLEQRPKANYGSGDGATVATSVANAETALATTTPAEPTLPGAEAPNQPELSPRARLAMIELAHKIAAHPRGLQPGAGWGEDMASNYAVCGARAGSYWTDPAFSELQSRRYVRAVHLPGELLVALTDQGVAWFHSHVVSLSLPPSQGMLQNSQIMITGVPLDWSQTYATPWLETEAAAPAAPPAPEPEPEQTALLDSSDDPWGRDQNEVVADTAVRDKVREGIAKAQAVGVFWAGAVQALATVGVSGPFTSDDNGAVVGVLDGQTVEILTVDVNAAIPVERADTIAALVAHALQIAFGAQD